MRIYTRTGDDGTTSLYSGERVDKDDARIELLGDLDESQAVLGLARAECPDGSELDEALLRIERELWLAMAEVASTPRRESDAPRLGAGEVERMEREIDELRSGLELAPAFAVPGDNRCSAALDVARTVVRRAERKAVRLELRGDLLTYLNRLSDLCWALARAAEEEHLVQRRPGAAPAAEAEH